MVPLCRRHHREFHQLGRLSFERKYDIDLLEMASAVWEYSPYRKPARSGRT